MAQLSVSISTEYGSSFEISTSVQGLLNITARTYILSGYNNPDGSPRVHLYSNDVLNIHGTPADLRLFAERLIDATEEPAPEPACECTTINEGTVTEAERFWAWALGNRPPLPEPDAQIDAAREDSAYAPGAGDVEVIAAFNALPGPVKDAAVAVALLVAADNVQIKEESHHVGK
jgi:hypothetical protein